MTEFNPEIVLFLRRMAPYAGEHYMPNETVLELTRQLRVGSIEAITGAGKTYTVEQAIAYAAKHPDIIPTIHRAQSSVTRKKRGIEVVKPTYRRYFDLSKAKDRQEVRDHLLSRDLVQVEVHPETGHLYMTEVEAYDPDAFNIVELMANARQRVLEKGILRDIKQVSLVPADMKLWRDLLHGRDETMTDLEEYKRVREGQVSIIGSLSNPSMQFVVNHYDNEAHIGLLQAWSGRLTHEVSDIGRVAAETALVHLDGLILDHPGRAAYENELTTQLGAAA